MRENFKMPVCAGRNTKSRLLPVMLLLVACFWNIKPALSQTIVGPSTGDNLFVSSVTSVANINNALIDYWYGGNEAQLMGVTWDGGILSTSFSFTISDGGASPSVTTTIYPPSGAGYSYVSGPDITFGGDNYAATTGYTVGIVYQALNTPTTLGDIYMDVYTVSNPGSGSMTVTPVLGATSIPITTSGTAKQWPHIDIIGKDDGFGDITCNNFFVTWAQGNNVGGLYYDFNDLISNGNFSGASIRPICTNCNFPDVAGIERNVGGNIDDIGLFIYTTVPATDLYYREWDVDAPSMTTPALIDNTTQFPRIDAIDDNLLSSTSGLAHYDIAYMYTGYPSIRSYNDLYGIVDCSTGTFASNSNPNSWSYYPTVACGVNTDYTIGYYYGGDFYSQQIDWTTGNLDPNTSPASYYEVNYNSGVSNRIVVSKACNTEYADYTLLCWYNGTNSEIDYKLNSTNPPSYKPNPTVVNNVNNSGAWALSPNPAINALMLSTADNAKGDNYRITDIMGRDILQGNIHSSSQSIDVNSLAAGTYFMNIYATGNRMQTIQFVKE